jgi:hypothetical protein
MCGVWTVLLAVSLWVKIELGVGGAKLVIGYQRQYSTPVTRTGVWRLKLETEQRRGVAEGVKNSTICKKTVRERCTWHTCTGTSARFRHCGVGT